jgi:hypothetical protein
MRAGGFDAVIGNPPYGVPFLEMENDYLADHFPETEKFPDSYCLFIVEALRLVRDSGFLSFIVPNTFCDLENCDAFRGWLLRGYTLQEYLAVGMGVQECNRRHSRISNSEAETNEVGLRPNHCRQPRIHTDDARIPR